MKADIIKWSKEKWGLDNFIPSALDINQFAEDYAKEKAIGFDSYIHNMYYKGKPLDEGLRDSDYENYNAKDSWKLEKSY